MIYLLKMITISTDKIEKKLESISTQQMATSTTGNEKNFKFDISRMRNLFRACANFN